MPKLLKETVRLGNPLIETKGELQAAVKTVAAYCKAFGLEVKYDDEDEMGEVSLIAGYTPSTMFDAPDIFVSRDAVPLADGTTCYVWARMGDEGTVPVGSTTRDAIKRIQDAIKSGVPLDPQG